MNYQEFRSALKRLGKTKDGMHDVQELVLTYALTATDIPDFVWEAAERFVEKEEEVKPGA